MAEGDSGLPEGHFDMAEGDLRLTEGHLVTSNVHFRTKFNLPALSFEKLIKKRVMVHFEKSPADDANFRR